MIKDEALLAEEVLHTVRATADPTRVDRARNLALIDQRLGAGAGSRGAEAAGVTPPLAAATAGAILRVLQPAPGASGALTALGGRFVAGGAIARLSPRLGFAVKAGLWLSFALTAGVVGYLWGRADERRSLAPSALEAPARPEPQGDLPGPAGTAAPASMTATSPAASDPAASGPAEGDSAAGDSTAGDDAAPFPRAVTAAPSAADRRRAVAHPSSAAPVRDGAAAPSRGDAQGGSATAAAAPQRLELREAIELLRRAEAALRRRDALEATLFLSDLDRRAPSGMLLEERLVARTLAACALGDPPQAHAALRELTRLNAQSIYRARLEGSCVAPSAQAP